MNCKYCNKEINNKGGLIKHENGCKFNPNRIIYTFNKIKGKSGWSKGLTKETDERLKRLSESVKKAYKTEKCINHQKGKKRTEEEKRKISETMKKNPKAGGLRQGSGRGKKGWYESKIAGKVFLDSSWELEYVKYLDKNNINWKRNKIKFPYIKDEKERYYIPDFYLVDTNEYVEVKGFERKEDKLKWSSFPYKLTTLKYEDLVNLGLSIKK